MLRLPRRVAARFVALVRADPAGVRAGFGALLISAVTGLLAGTTLGAITGTLEELPGLLVLVPAAIGMRGNVFGALGSRLGTSIHTGTFRLTLRRGTLVGQNLAASMSLSVSVALILAVIAKLVSVTFGVASTMSVADFVVISVVGGTLSSAVVMVITVGVAALSVRRDWDLDNVAAPIVTSAGDFVTMPGLLVATWLVGIDWVTPAVATLCAAAALVLLWRGLRARGEILRSIVRESVPVLALAGAVDIVAGLTVEKRIEAFAALPALLILFPPFLGQSGSLGGILSSRLSTKLHLGTLPPGRFALGAVAEDVLLVVVYAVPVYLLLGLSVNVAAAVGNLAGPGFGDLLGAALLAGAMTTGLVVAVAYLAAVASHRLGLDPDNHGIPLVTATLDLGGSLALILSLVILGLT